MRWSDPKVVIGIVCVLACCASCIGSSVWVSSAIGNFIANTLNRPYEHAAEYLKTLNVSPIVVLRQGSGETHAPVGSGGAFLLVDTAGLVIDLPDPMTSVQHGGLIKTYTITYS